MRTYMGGKRETTDGIAVFEALEPRLLLSADLSGWECYLSSNTLNWGDSFTIQGQIKNDGTAVSTDFWVEFSLSNDTTFGDADDIRMTGWDYEHTADIGANSLGPDFTTATFTLPSTAPLGYSGTGPFYIGMYTDSWDQVAESDETNNGPGDIGLFLDYDSFTVPPPSPDLYDDGDDWSEFTPQTVTEGAASDAWEAHWDIRNGGAAAAGGFRVDFYASTDDIISTGDYSLGDVWVPGVSADDYETASLYLTDFPDSVPAGTYYVGVIIDSTNNVAESNEGNNTGVDYDYYPLTVNPPPLPDLSGWDCYLSSSTLNWGDSFTIQGQIKNDGTAVSTDFRVDFCLSNDTTFGDADDIWLTGWDYEHTANIGANSLGPDFTTDPFTLPSTAPSGYSGTGPFYIGMYTDSWDQVAESDETNNGPGDTGPIFDYDHFTVPNQAPTITSLSDNPDPVIQGNTLTLTANGVSDDHGVASVSFYRDANSNGVGEAGELLGTDTSASGGWTWSGAATWAIGPHTYLARATDDGIASPVMYSSWVSTTGTVQASWHNSPLPQDVNGSGTVEPLDVLLIIWQLNHPTMSHVPLPTPPFPPPYYDVSGDGNLSAIDALMVIWYLNNPPPPGGSLSSSQLESSVVTPGVIPQVVPAAAAWGAIRAEAAHAFASDRAVKAARSVGIGQAKGKGSVSLFEAGTPALAPVASANPGEGPGRAIMGAAGGQIGQGLDVFAAHSDTIAPREIADNVLGVLGDRLAVPVLDILAEVPGLDIAFPDR